MQCFRRRFGLLLQNMAKIILEKVSKELKLVKIVVTSRFVVTSILAVMMTVQQSFSVVKNPVTMVNDR